MVLGVRRHWKECSRRQGHNRYRPILTRVKQQWQSGWPYGLFIRCAQSIRATRDKGVTRSRGGVRRQITNS